MCRWILLKVLLLTLVLKQGYGLSCLRCQESDVYGGCRYGHRPPTKVAQKTVRCFGDKARCYIIAAVDSRGVPGFERGCTKDDLCRLGNENGVEFCWTCRNKYCNYDAIDLDEDTENYLDELLQEHKRNTPVRNVTVTHLVDEPVRDVPLQRVVPPPTPTVIPPTQVPTEAGEDKIDEDLKNTEPVETVVTPKHSADILSEKKIMTKSDEIITPMNLYNINGRFGERIKP